MSFFLTSAISTLIVLGIMVLVHEFGHFIVAKLCGVRVEVFSVGFGQRLFGFRRGDTDYRLSLLPLGGYVKMSGEYPTASGEMPSAGQAGDPGEFGAHPRWQRVLIALAGPAANFLLAVGLMTGLYMLHNEVDAYESAPARIDFVPDHTPAAAAGFQPGDLITNFDSIRNPTWKQVSIRTALDLGHPTPVTVDRNGEEVALKLTVPNPRDEGDFDLETIGFIPREQEAPMTIIQIEANMPAQKAGLKVGDQVLSINGLALHSVSAVIPFLQQNGSQPIHLAILRAGKTFEVQLQPVLGDPGDGHKIYRIGFGPKPVPFKVEQLPLPAAFVQSVHFNVRYSALIFEVLRRMVERKLAVQNLIGPVGIARETGLAVEQPGWQPLMSLSAIISLNLGIINLLPVPILDGGTIFLLLIEGFLRRDLNQEFKERIYQVAFVVLILFFVFIMFNDISKLPVFGKLRP
jgi:regulator of sigma E protease